MDAQAFDLYENDALLHCGTTRIASELDMHVGADKLMLRLSLAMILVRECGHCGSFPWLVSIVLQVMYYLERSNVRVIIYTATYGTVFIIEIDEQK